MGVSPVGSSVSEDIARHRRTSATYRAEDDRLAPFEQIARIVILQRARLGLTQQELAERMGTSHSAISRIESGQHATSIDTLRRLGDALGLRFVMGFESGPRGRPRRELVRV